MSQSWVIAMFVAVVLVLMLAFTLLDIWTAAPDEPNYGLALVVDDPTEDDPMDAYLEQRAAGNGVLPAPKIHPACFDALCDREPSKICPDCVPLLEGVKPVVTR